MDGIPPAPRGVPQIEVSFDVDSNGILNVSACDKASGKSQQITIKNDKGRLSQDDIDRMVNDAEKYKEQDDLLKQRIDAKNELENLCYQTKSSVEKDELKDKLTEEDTKTILDKVEETLSKIEDENLDTEQYKQLQQELMTVSGPIMQKLYQNMGEGEQQQQQQQQTEPQNSSEGPTIEEVD